MKNIHLLIIFLLFLCIASSQNCLNHKRQSVDWFLIMKTPGSVSKGYLYYDSTMNQTDLTLYENEADSIDHPISNTFDQINNNNLSIITWNDKMPNGTTSSTKAHSKHIIAYNDDFVGIVIIHSMPAFPSVIDNKLNRNIDDSQNIYGQHLICLTTGNFTKSILQRSTMINAFIYANTNNYTFPFYAQNRLFQTLQLKIGQTNIKSIYKNGRRSNGSIFQDGLTIFLQSNFIAETWGRPYQPKWCGNQTNPYTVVNNKGIYHSQSIKWASTQDHSKWAITTRQNLFYICLGDMNRMDSQWRRGGSFTCIQNKLLHQALLKKLVDPQKCIPETTQ